MPVITCPKCKGKLRFPDDSSPRRVKCPTCGQVFFSSEGTEPDAPTVRSASRPDLPKARDSRGEFDLPMDDDDDDRRRRSRRHDDDDDRDDDRYRRRGGRRYADDDDDERRRRGRRRDDYDADRPRRPRDDPRAIEREYDRASLACLLYFIGGWLQVAALGLLVFMVLLDWFGLNDGNWIFAIMAGLLGLGYLLTGATGFGFLVTGPRKRGALGLAIATAAVAGVHLILAVLIATSRNWGAFANTNLEHPAQVHWEQFVSQLRALPFLLFFQIGWGDIIRNAADGSFVPVVANFAEVARMVLFLLTLRAIMLSLRDHTGASLCMKAMIGFAAGAGGLLIAGMVFGLLALAVRPNAQNAQAFETMSAVSHLFALVMYLVLTGLSVGVNLIVRSVKHRLDYR